jgi:hypothetical protein
MVKTTRQSSVAFSVWVCFLSTTCVILFLIVSNAVTHSRVLIRNKSSPSTHSHHVRVYYTLYIDDEPSFDPIAIATISSSSIPVRHATEITGTSSYNTPITKVSAVSLAPKQSPPLSPHIDSVI